MEIILREPVYISNFSGVEKSLRDFLREWNQYHEEHLMSICDIREEECCWDAQLRISTNGYKIKYEILHQVLEYTQIVKEFEY